MPESIRDERTYRQRVDRVTRFNRRRPSPPRDVAYLDGVLSWKPPADQSGVTHYRVYKNSDDNIVREVPVGQTQIEDNLVADRVMVSAWNESLGLESGKTPLNASVYPGGTVSGAIAISAISKSLSASNDFGVRFWLVDITYTSNIPGLLEVQVWQEHPEDAAPQKAPGGKLVYIPSATNHAIVAIEPPDANSTDRFYLTAITAALIEPLKTVADYGEPDSSPHASIELTPVPAETQGVEYTGNVTGQSIGAVTYYDDANGVKRSLFTATFAKPANEARWGGVELVAKKPGPRYVTLGRYYVSPSEVETVCPYTVESWRVFFVSFDKNGKRNTICEGCGGTDTPYADISIGAAAGTLDLGKALAASVGTALEVVANVLGVQDEGITEDLIATFAVSQAKLANAPIIDAVRIVDGAVTNAKIVNLAANKILAGTLAAGVIYAGQIDANQVNAGTFNGMSLILNKNGITTTIDSVWDGSQYVGIKVANNASGANAVLGDIGAVVRNSGSYVVLEARESASEGSIRINNSTGGNVITIRSLSGVGSVTVNGASSYVSVPSGYIASNEYRVGGTIIVTSSRVLQNVTSGHFRPDSDSAYDLGHSNYFWLNAYIDALRISDTFRHGAYIILNSSRALVNLTGVTVVGDVLCNNVTPQTHNTYDLGTSSAEYAEAHIVKLCTSNNVASGSPAAAATHKVPVYNASGALLNYMYLYP